MFLILFRNILCPQQMFPSLRAQGNVMSNKVSSFARLYSRYFSWNLNLQPTHNKRGKIHSTWSNIYTNVLLCRFVRNSIYIRSCTGQWNSWKDYTTMDGACIRQPQTATPHHWEITGTARVTSCRCCVTIYAPPKLISMFTGRELTKKNHWFRMLKLGFGWLSSTFWFS